VPGGADAAQLDVGRVLRPHGLRGDVVVELWTNRPERLEAGSRLSSDRGPLEVRAARPHRHRYLVRFSGVDDVAGAEALRGAVLRAEVLDEPDVLWVHELVGSEVVTVDGRRLGRVHQVEANPASDLLVLDEGALVPLHFVVAHGPGRLTVEIPDGLVD
jgi:16S rRNA processing protein RimM